MKKLLLLSSVGFLGAAAAHAEVPTPKTFLDACINAIAPNGSMFVSEIYGALTIYDLANDEHYEYVHEYANYTVGGGNSVSNTGIVVGTTPDLPAAYWEDGDWYALPLPENATSTCVANGITPDGKRICGSIGLPGDPMAEDVLMQTPVVWEQDGNGYYNTPIMLPHPEYDFAGRIPQYCLALEISADGKTIVGQVTDCGGAVCYPIVYKEDANGEWSYTIPHEELLNPNEVDLSGYPGTMGAQPDELDFMDDDNAALWQEDYELWIESGYTLPYPEKSDYLSEEQKAAFQEALEAYQAEYAAWEEAYNEWEARYRAAVDLAPGYVMNDVHLHPDGKSFVVNVQADDPDAEPDPLAWFHTYAFTHPWSFSLENDNITKYTPIDKISVTSISSDGTMFATGDRDTVNKAYVITPKGVCQTLQEWMAERVPEYATWMEENMKHDIESYNWDTGEFETEEGVLASGIPMADQGHNLVGTWANNLWDYETNADSYLFDMKGAGAGITSVSADKSAEGAAGIYDLYGRRLEKADAPGFYIINGKKAVVR